MVSDTAKAPFAPEIQTTLLSSVTGIWNAILGSTVTFVQYTTVQTTSISRLLYSQYP